MRRACVGLLVLLACQRKPTWHPTPAMVLVDESVRWKAGEALPHTTPWFNGAEVTMAAARGETLGLQVIQAQPLPVRVRLDHAGVRVTLHEVAPVTVARPSTSMFGASRGEGQYYDVVRPAVGVATVMLLEVVVAADAKPGTVKGVLTVGEREYPVRLTVHAAALAIEARPWVWAYYSGRDMDGFGPAVRPRAEPACQMMFRQHGVLLASELEHETWQQTLPAMHGAPYVPVYLPPIDEPAKVAADVRLWRERLAGTGQVPFAIPVDEPQDASALAEVRAYGAAIRAGGGGPGAFLFAVTMAAAPEFDAVVDAYFLPWSGTRTKPQAPKHWTYNGRPPHAGNLTVDSAGLSLRTWGAIGQRYDVEWWYIWNALYWRDRHNRKRSGIEGGKPLDITTDAVSYDSGEDRGNLDGVLAFPEGETCAPSLRLKQLRRGMFDRALMRAAACKPAEVEAIAARLMPRALGDASRGQTPAWPDDIAVWEQARRELLQLADGCLQAP